MILGGVSRVVLVFPACVWMVTRGMVVVVVECRSTGGGLSERREARRMNIPMWCEGGGGDDPPRCFLFFGRV